jgi:hypothetical protein
MQTQYCNQSFILKCVCACVAAERVSQKEKLEVAGCWVTVNLLPARPLQRVLGETYPTMAVVKHFREDCPTRTLKAFLQEKSQTTVTDIEYSLRPSVAMVYFDKTPGELCSAGLLLI